MFIMYIGEQDSTKISQAQTFLAPIKIEFERNGVLTIGK
jgi:hypothetical protein